MNILSGPKHNLDSFVRKFDGGIWSIVLMGFFNSASFSMSLPFISLYMNQDRGLPMTVVGLIILIGGLVSAAAQVYAGALCDRLGRRPLMIISTIASTILYGVMALLVAINSDVWIIALFYTLARVAMMIPRPAIQAMIVDLCPRQQLAEANGLLRIGQNLGWAIGPALGGYLLSSLSYAWLFCVGMLLSFLPIVIVTTTIKESYAGSGDNISFASIFSPAQDRDFLTFTLLCIVLALVMGQMSSTLSVYCVGRIGFSTAQYGALLTLNGIIVVTCQYPASRMVDRMPKRNALMLGSLLYAAGYGMIGLVGPYSIAVIALIVITLGEIIIAPANLAVTGDLAPNKQRGRYMGFLGLSETVGVSAGPLLGGVFMDIFPQSNIKMWGLISLVAVISCTGFYFWGNRAARSHSSST
jgi:MFS family permease